MIIPEGREGGGSRGFSQEVDGILTPAGSALHHQRRQMPSPVGSEVHKNSNTGGESRTFKEAVIHDNTIPKFLHASNGGRVDSQDSSKAVTDSVEIFLKVIVGHGLDNEWEVKWAGVVDKPSPITIQQGPQPELVTIPQTPHPVTPGPNVNNKPKFPINTNKPTIVTKPNISAKLISPLSLTNQKAQSLLQNMSGDHEENRRSFQSLLVRPQGPEVQTESPCVVRRRSPFTPSRAWCRPLSFHLSPRFSRGSERWQRPGVLRAIGLLIFEMADG